ncbi:MAG: sel1 repeat family protein [Lentisphaerae bacterium]|nr:sel1 repeat family protein [Lentisphaerota bacterium]
MSRHDDRNDRSQLLDLLSLGVIYCIFFSALLDIVKIVGLIVYWLRGNWEAMTDEQRRSWSRSLRRLALLVLLAGGGVVVGWLVGCRGWPCASQREPAAEMTARPSSETAPAQERPHTHPREQVETLDPLRRLRQDLERVAADYCAAGPDTAARLARARQQDWQDAALRDLPEGLCLAGICLEHGLWGQTDRRLALACYQRAADKGLALAQVILGLHYDAGVGVPRDADEALAWFRRAAAQGCAEGQLGVGLVLLGRDNATDRAEAARWLRLAAARGLPEAQHALTVAHDYGLIARQ